ncbi:MAG: exodeoxyribonuclease V subunit gamma [Magnetococcus sp. YQC-9]
MRSVGTSTGLTLIHGNRIEYLRADLVSRLQTEPLAPLANEIILVQSNGMAQWLKLGLAGASGMQEEGAGRGLGIAAALEMVLPARFLWRIYRTVLGREAVPEETPFDKTRLIWRLMRLIPALRDEAPFASLNRFLQNDSDLRKCYQLAGKLADLFDQYQVYRADWLVAWSQGKDLLIDARGGRQPIPEEQRWQPALWRRLCADVAAAGGGDGDPLFAGGRAAVHAAFMQRAFAQKGTLPEGLPERVTIFGISALPYQSLEVLMVLSRWTRVLMYVHNPCQVYWADVIAGRELFRARRTEGRGRTAARYTPPSEEALHLHAQPLLAAWGMQGRDFIALLEDAVGEGALWSEGVPLTFDPEREECFVAHGERAGTVLLQLQEDILELRPLVETCEHWPPVDPSRDRSIRFHIAHGPQREVEILHDQLLDAFNVDATLTPRDILVMVPDVDLYAAHIQAVFGLPATQDPRFIPFVVVNRTRRLSEPLVKILENLLGLPRARVTANDLLDWLELPAMRRRFGFSASDLPLLRRWIRDTGIRWGLDPDHCAVLLELPDAIDGARTRHTWRFGLERMLLGYALGDRGGAWCGIDPYDQIGLGDGELIGRLSALVAALEESRRLLGTPATVAEWCVRLRGLMEQFFDPDETDADGYTLLRLEESLDSWERICEEAGLNERLPLAVVGEPWLSSLEDGGLSQGFFAGAVTFATLMPMRAIPFRQVCLLGMNDGAFPRPATRLDFDLMAGRYRPGDRSRREDDRYLFLEALLSARERLSISWVGRSIHDNAASPPSVLVGQLRDHLAAGWRLAGEMGGTAESGLALLAALTVEHRLQPFAPVYFTSGADSDPRLFSYAREWLPESVQSNHKPVLSNNEPVHDNREPVSELHKPVERHAEPGDETSEDPTACPVKIELLPPVMREEPLRLLELAQLFKDPVRVFFQQRLGVRFEREELFLADHESFGLDALEQWLVIDELLAHREPAALEAGLERLRLRGALPAGGHGMRLAEGLRQTLLDLNVREQRLLARWPEELTGDWALHLAHTIEDGRYRLVDRLSGVRRGPDGSLGRIVRTASRVVNDEGIRFEALGRAWVEHLAWQLVRGAVTTVVLGGEGGVVLAPLGHDAAKTGLQGLIEAWWQGMRRPLPFLPRIGSAWLGGARAGNNGEQEAEKVFLRMREGNLYLQRAFVDFSAFYAGEELERWSTVLLQPLVDAATVWPDAGGGELA